jgi:CO/xanthine dehydrogenase Mo-binding subunit
VIEARSYIGEAIPRLEGPDKVTGRAQYTADVALPGMLWGRVLRSPHPHARIVAIDAAAARAIPGVRAVVTGQDVPGLLFGKVVRDMPVLCWDRVRFVGDRVAAVAADTPEAADAALAAISVEYEELPAVWEPLDAMEPGAPLLHDDPAGYEGAPAHLLATDLRNGQTRQFWSKGDVQQGFREAERVFEHTFRIPSRHQGYLEPHASLVAIDDAGRVQVWTASKAPFRARTQLAQAVGIPEERILVHVVSVGGDFGGKGDAMDAPIAYLLARETGRPVKVVMSFGEELTASNPSHPTILTVRSGVKEDGSLVAREMRVVHASGAYAALKPNGILSTYHYVGGAYRIPHTAFEFVQIYTNSTPGGYFRAPGAHQYTFAVESHTDLIAAELGLDPAELRLRNLIRNGETDGVGHEMTRIGAYEVLRAALDAAGWDQPKRAPNVGRGMTLFGRQIGGGPGGAVLTAHPDGTISLLSPTFDMGAGTHTIEQQLIATELGLPLDRVRVVVGDTDNAPYDDGPRASRVTYTEGQAVVQACEQLRAKLTESAARLLDAREDQVSYRDEVFTAEGREITLAEAVRGADEGRPLTVTVELSLPQREDVAYYCAQVAEVEVDPATGQVRVDRLVTAHDVGTIINPVTHQGQIDGGAITGIGLALTEELVLEEGRIVNGNLGEYKLPTTADIPTLETVLVSSPGGTGPHEAKAIGEMANNGPPAAIANAVADAVGARVYELPITSERVYAALAAQRGEPA